MPSAADRIPNEIWEQVILQAELTTRDLFRLQGVNKSIYRTINGSTPLLRTMEIIHKPVEEKKHRVPNPMLWTSHLELRPFTYRIEVLAPASPRNGGDRWNILVHVVLNLASEARVTGSTLAFGVKSNKRVFGDVLDGSWRRMKIARFPVVIDIPMRIYYLDMYYEDKVSDPTGQMTLGELANLLEAVHERTSDEHQRRADAFKETDGRKEPHEGQGSSCRMI